jgi:hypothetical protein
MLDVIEMKKTPGSGLGKNRPLSSVPTAQSRRN